MTTPQNSTVTLGDEPQPARYILRRNTTFYMWGTATEPLDPAGGVEIRFDTGTVWPATVAADGLVIVWTVPASEVDAELARHPLSAETFYSFPSVDGSVPIDICWYAGPVRESRR